MKDLISKIITTTVVALLFTTSFFAQRGKDGLGSITVANTVVNTVSTNLTVDVTNTTTSSVKVASNAGISSGDLLLIIQMQGARLEAHKDSTAPWFDTNNSIPSTLGYGAVANYYTAGNNEFAEVESVMPDGITINLDCALKNKYTVFGVVQVIRVPRYTTLSVSGGGSITCNQWNGSTGGIAVVEVKYTSTLSATPSFNVSGKGFRGGAVALNSATTGSTNYGSQRYTEGGRKGEGIGGDTARYRLMFSGVYGRGAVGNGGGGGDAHNAGGGGGSNGGNIASFFDGQGNPVAGYTNQWNQEGGVFSSHVSTGGGRGGYTMSANNNNPSTTAPGAAAWGGDNRRNYGGLGGRPLDYTGGRLFLGGGGGSGHQNDSYGGAGGNGGGMVYILGYGNISGAGTITADGANGGTTTNDGAICAGRDGAGGAGGGGTVIINTMGTVNLTAGTAISAKGGTGGNQTFYTCASSDAYGPGGGGGGGYIATSGTIPSNNISGGANGIVSGNSSTIKTSFPPNGATVGGAGSTGAVTTFSVSAAPQTICAGNTATLTATTSGTLPAGGVTINWYSASSGGSPIASGTTFTTPVLNANAVYYVGTCPGTYRDSVKITVTAGLSTPVPTSNSAICAGQTLNLSANVTGVTWAWTGPNSFSSTSQNPTIANATAAAAGTYSLVVSSGSCSSTAGTVNVTVNAIPATPVPTSNSAICEGQTLNLGTNVAGVTWAWTGPNSFSSTSQNPTIANATTAATGTYSLVVTNAGCSSTAGTVAVTVNAIPATPVPTSNSAICEGQTLNLSANVAGVTWAWTGPNSFSSTSQNPTIPSATTAATGTYSLVVTNAGCSSIAGTVAVTVNAIPATPVPTSNSAICEGQTLNLSANVNGVTWAWTGPNSFSSTSQNPTIPIATTAATGTYSLVVSNAGCNSVAGTIAVTVNAVPATPVPTSNSPVCTGQTINLFTNQVGTTYTWTGPNAFSDATQNPTITNASAANDGTYTVTVTSNGCTSAQGTVVVTTTSTSNPTINSVANLCQNAAPITLTAATGGGTWTGTGITNGATGTFDPATAVVGTDTITYTLSGACGGSDTVVIHVLANANPAITNAPTSLCLTGSPFSLTTAQAGGTWSGTGVNASGSFDPSVAGLGMDTVIYTISGACGSADTAIIQVNATSNATITNVAAMCQNAGTITLSAAQGGGVWSGNGITNAATGTFDPSLAAVGTDTITYTISGACGASDTTVITVNANANPAITNAPASICVSATPITLTTAQAGGTWSGTGVNASGVFDPSIAGLGMDTVIYTISGTCGSADTAIIQVNSSSNATITNVAAMCQNAGTITLTAAQAGGVWSGNGITNAATGSFDPSLAAVGTDTITYTISGVCGAVDTAVITVYANANATITNPPATLCSNNSIVTLTTVQSGGTWSGQGVNASGVFDPSLAPLGIDTVIYTLSGSCSDADTVYITVTSFIDATISNAGPFCRNASATTLTAANTGGTWSGTGITNVNAGTFDPHSANVGANTITYTIPGTCGGTGTTVITVNDTAVATITNAPATICANADSVILTTAQSGGIWSGAGVNASGVFHPNIAGNGPHYIKYTIGGTCGDVDSVSILVNNSAGLSFTNLPTICKNDCDTFYTTSSATCSTLTWDFGDGTVGSGSNPYHCYTTDGSYTVTAVCTTTQGCVDSVKVPNAVTVNPLPDSYFTIDQYNVGVGIPVTFTATNPGNSSIHWHFGEPASGASDSSNVNPGVHSYSSIGQYCTKLEVVSLTTGCYNYSTGCMDVIADGSVIIPNVFTPNGDGNNDLFNIKSDGLKSLSCTIFDRWGLKVGSWDGLNGSWDGKNNGNKVPDGIYYYIVKYTDLKSATKEVSGFVQLIN